MDVGRVKVFEDDHNGAPVIGCVQMDWPLPFSSEWNAAAIHVLAMGFWDLHKDTVLKDAALSLDDIKALCIRKLNRTRQEHNLVQNADDMDTSEDGSRSAKAAISRRKTRKTRVSCSLHYSQDIVDGVLTDQSFNI